MSPIGPVRHALELQREAQEEAEALRQEVERLKAELRESEAWARLVAVKQREACADHLGRCGYFSSVVRECEDAPLVEAEK